MKPIVLIVACATVLLLNELTEAQVPVGPVGGVVAPVVPPVFPPMLGAMPFPFLGPFGFPFMGPLGGLLALRGLALLGRKKRDVPPPIVNDVRCVIATSNRTIECSIGVDKRVGCGMEPRLSSLASLKVNLVDLQMVERVDGNTEIINLVSTKSNSKLAAFLNKANLSSSMFTFIHPSTLQPTLLGVYANPALGVPGFLVKDQQCFNSLVSIVRSNSIRVRSKLLIQ